MFSLLLSKCSPDSICTQTHIALTNVSAASSHRNCLHLKTTLHSLPYFVSDAQYQNMVSESNCIFKKSEEKKAAESHKDSQENLFKTKRIRKQNVLNCFASSFLFLISFSIDYDSILTFPPALGKLTTGCMTLAFMCWPPIST